MSFLLNLMPANSARAAFHRRCEIYRELIQISSSHMFTCNTCYDDYLHDSGACEWYYLLRKSMNLVDHPGNPEEWPIILSQLSRVKYGSELCELVAEALRHYQEEIKCQNSSIKE